MKARQISKNTSIPKSERYCPKCDNIKVFGFNILKGHSCCTNCGMDSKNSKFIRWCNPNLVELPYRNKKSQMSKELIKKVLERNKLRGN